MNTEKTFANDLRAKYNILKNNNIIIDYKIYDEIDFKCNLLKNIENFPIHHLNIIIKTMEDVLSETRNPKKFRKIINNKLEENLTNLYIPDKQKEKLRKIISKNCMIYINEIPESTNNT